MASTGLLGFNPYGKAVSLDISSKPINLAIQLEQKEAAKKEALDKYFMDYEKSLSPTGMRSQDQDVFMQKLNANKSFYLQNRDKILNPTKYGAQYQSQYMAGFKDMLSDVSRSKQAAANDKVAQEHYYQAQQKGLEVPDGYMDAVAMSQLPINKGYQPIDPYKWNFNKPFDVEEFRKDIYGNVQPSEKRIKSTPDNKGEIIDLVKYELAPDQLKSITTNAIMKYQNDAGVKKQVNNLIRTGQYKNLDEYYKLLDPKGTLDDANPEHVAAALGLSLNLIGKTAEKRREDKMYWINQQEGKERRTALYKKGLEEPAGSDIHIFDKIGGEGNPVTLPADTKTGRVYKINYGIVEDEKGNPATITTQVAGTDLPQDIFSILKESKLTKDDDYIIKSQDGKIVSIKPVDGSLITREYAGDEQSLYYGTKKDLKKNKTTTPVVAETWADRLKKKRK